MPANDTDSPSSDTPDAYDRDDGSAAQPTDAPVTISDLKSDTDQTSSTVPAPSPPDSDSDSETEMTAADTVDAQSRGTAETTDQDDATTWDLDAIRTEILEGIGRHGDRTWFQLGSYHTPMNKRGMLVKVHLDDATWYCLLEEQPRGLATRYTIEAMGPHLTVEPLLPDMDTMVDALTAQRHQDIQTGQAEPVTPFSAEQRRQFRWAYAHLTMDVLQQQRLAAEQRSTDTQMSVYSRYVIATVDVSELRDRVEDAVSCRQLAVVVESLWEAADANPTVPPQLLSQVTGRVPLVGRLVFQ